MFLTGKERKELWKWLISHVEPSALYRVEAVVRYVVQLVESAKTLGELEENCTGELVSLLTGDARRFARLLRECIRNGDYLLRANNSINRRDRSGVPLGDKSRWGSRLEEKFHVSSPHLSSSPS